MSSFDSVKGPSTTVRFCPAYLTRHPFDVACSPEASSSTPAFCSSSWYFAISVRIFSCGMTPASESFVAFTMIMKRIVFSLLTFRVRPGDPRPCDAGCRLTSRSTGIACLPPPRGLLHVGREVRQLLHLDHPVAAEQLFGLGEGPVGDLGLPTGESDAGALRGWVQPVEAEQHAGLVQGLVVLRHLGDEVGRGHEIRWRIFVRLRDYQHHESHSRVSLSCRVRSRASRALPCVE